MPISTSVTDRIAEVVFDQPPVNALDIAGWHELPTRSATPGARRCQRRLLRADGRGFCAGVDIKELAREPR